MSFFIKSIKYCYALIRNKKDIRLNYVEGCHNYYLFFVACGRNMGDHAIVESEEKFIRQYDSKAVLHEIIVSDTVVGIKELKKIKDLKEFTIVLSGGGYIGDEYIEVYLPLKEILKTFVKNKIIVFPQTVYFKSEKRERRLLNLFKKCINLTFFTREYVSYSKLVLKGLTNILVPDIVLFNERRKHSLKKSVILCLRDDVEKNLSLSDFNTIIEFANRVGCVRYMDTVYPDSFPLDKRKTVLDQMLEEFRCSALVITDRIHGMIFSYLTETPCIVLGNYNHKVKSEFKWLEKTGNIVFLEHATMIELENSLRTINNHGEGLVSISKEDYNEIKKRIETW